MSGLERPLLVYDGDCGFCRRWVERWRWRTGDAIGYEPFQTAAARFPQIPLERFRNSVAFIEPGERASFAAEAVFRLLSGGTGASLWLALYQRLPGFRWVSEAAYRLVARHRDVFDRLTRLLWGERLVPQGYAIASWLFLRALALVYLAAFASLGLQVTGLIGQQGILPIASYLSRAASVLGFERFWLIPTLCWWNAGDLFLRLQCLAGCGAALLLFAGFAPAAMSALLWLLYLSLSTAGQEFLWFQWDSLLLEAGFLAMFLAPWRLWSFARLDRSPPAGPRRMLRWLLFRLMFSSAVVKLSSGDPTWRRLTATCYHYETQPLPAWTAWYAHHLPAWFHSAEAALLFGIEGLVPFLIFLPRRPRTLAAMFMIVLQGLIVLGGNYGFFNLLTMALCLLLLDDGVWPARLRRLIKVEEGTAEASLSAASAGFGRHAARGRPEHSRHWPIWISRPVLLFVFVLTIAPLVDAFRSPARWQDGLRHLNGAVAQLHLANPYGLFAVMTTSRPEIIVEGSNDGESWRRYEFRWKPGDLDRRPAFVAPHMPRLDWQMWFAALDRGRVEPWYLSFSQRLLEGSKPVLALLKSNPFPERPPRYVRALLYDYHFTNPAPRRATGAWWTRKPLGEYAPPLTLINGHLGRAGPLSSGSTPSEGKIDRGDSDGARREKANHAD